MVFVVAQRRQKSFVALFRHNHTNGSAKYPGNRNWIDISTDVRTRREIIQAINSLKNGKALGHDSLNAELFKANLELAVTILNPLFKKIWEQEKIPTDWSRGGIIKIPKKGSLRVIVTTGEELPFCLCRVKSFARSFFSASPQLLVTSCGTSNLDFARGVDVWIIFSHCRTYLNNVEWNRGLYVNFIDHETHY